MFLWLPDPAEARRVVARVAQGGHAVAADVVYRRYAAGLRNFFGLYQPLATAWRFYDTSALGPPRLLAPEHALDTSTAADPQLWTDRVRQWSQL